MKSVEFQISKKEEIKQMSCEKINKLSPLNTNHNNYSDMEDPFATQGTCSWNPDSRYPSGDQSLANVIPVLRILGRPSLPSPSFSSPPQGHPRDQFWGPSFKVPTRGPISGRCDTSAQETRETQFQGTHLGPANNLCGELYKREFKDDEFTTLLTR